MFKNDVFAHKEHFTRKMFLRRGFYFRSSAVLNDISGYLETLYSFCTIYTRGQTECAYQNASCNFGNFFVKYLRI